jgi:hypothetical protein
MKTLLYLIGESLPFIAILIAFYLFLVLTD